MSKENTKKPSKSASNPAKKAGRESYFFGALKKIALTPFLGGAAKASTQSGENWDQIDPFHHRPDLGFT